MKPRFCLIGQVVVDVLHLESGPVVRLGGIFHAAKVLSSLGYEFEIAYVAPKYLESEIASYAQKLAAAAVIKLGDVEGCPNVLLVGEPTEAGSQNYEFLLDRQHRCTLNLLQFENHIRENPPTDVIVFPGGFEVKAILLTLKKFTAHVHVDANFEPENFETFEALGRPLQTLILSTSSDTFLKTFKGHCESVRRAGLKIAQSFLLKENRGGSRYFQRKSTAPILVPAFPRKIIHSVGAGDCFDSVFVCLSRNMSPTASLFFASLLAAEYASVLDQSLFSRAVNRTMKIKPKEVTRLRGVSLPWELRPRVHIYIAAPDFRSADRSQIERAISCLRYHNFTPRRPVVEHGEVTVESSAQERSAAALSDIRLLNDCQILLAIPIFDDPGTYIEMGVALQKNIPVILYRPNSITDNLLTSELPTLVSSDLDEVISEVFNQAARIHGS
jgi:nucleoside 2-deoxyribosyltransferase